MITGRIHSLMFYATILTEQDDLSPPSFKTELKVKGNYQPIARPVGKAVCRRYRMEPVKVLVGYHNRFSEAVRPVIV
jgi:hypothetical protein